MSALLSIGEFSKLTHLSVKALRHYRDVGLLVPAAIDAGSRYRRYDATQARDAQLIRRLRALDMPLDAIRDVVTAVDPTARDATIATHLARMEGELARTQEVVASLRALLAFPMPDVAALAIREVVAKDDVERRCGAAFGELWTAVAATGARVSGPGGGVYSAAFFTEDAGPVAAYVPVMSAPPATSGRVEVIPVPGGDVLVAMHVGPFEDLDRTYAVLGAAANERGIATDAAIRELYIVGPDATDDPQEFRTEICWPIIAG
ncbi:MAG: MerR family transcriptional regulator [Jiangellaceae bacterium]